MSSWADLGLCDALVTSLKALGWDSPKDIQSRAIPVVVQSRKDVIGAAKTGSGKTGAFTLPMINDLLSMPTSKRARFHSLIISPTRDLAKQIHEEVKKFVAHLPTEDDRAINSMMVTGGTFDTRMRTQLMGTKPIHILVATPGRLRDILEGGFAGYFGGLRYFVLDEADRLLKMDFQETMGVITGHLNKGRKFAVKTTKEDQTQPDPTRRISMMFSATMDAANRGGMMRTLRKAIIDQNWNESVDVDARSMPEMLSQYMAPVLGRPHLKDLAMIHFINDVKSNQKNASKQIIFANTKVQVDRLARLINTFFGVEPPALKEAPSTPAAPRAAGLHGDLRQECRNSVIRHFQAGTATVLVCTDVAGRGFDAPGVTQVINYDLPPDHDAYVHRAGRTARNGAEGRAVTLITKDDLQRFLQIEAKIGVEMGKLNCPETPDGEWAGRFKEACAAGDEVSRDARDAMERLRKQGGRRVKRL